MNEEQNNSVPENLPVLPGVPMAEISIKPKRAWKIWIITIIVLALSGTVLLWLLGDIFVSEIVLDFDIDRVERSEVNKKAPYFELDNIKGGTVKLSDYLGKPAVIVFWTSWNQMAVDQLRIISSDITAGDKDIFSIVAINSQEDRSVVANFIQRGGYEAEVLMDVSGEITALYEARVLPVIYFIDAEGKVREIYVGALDAKIIVDKVGKLLSDN